MAVDIELFGLLAEELERRHSLILESQVSVSEVAALIGVVPEEVGLVTIDGVQSTMQDTVPLNCRLCFFPPMSGG